MDYSYRMHVSVMYEATVPHCLRYKDKGSVAEKKIEQKLFVFVYL